MPAERWVLLGIANPEHDRALKSAIIPSGCRTTRVQTAADCRDLLKRRLFFCAFLDRPIYAVLAKQNLFPSLTYVVVAAQEAEMSKAVDLQQNGRIHDWISMPPSPVMIRSLLTRARTFARQAGELESIKASAADAIQKDAAILCAGAWADIIKRSMEKACNRDTPIVLIGEPGSGKTLLARLFHLSSKRSIAPFVIVRCKDRDSRELEREIFGEIPPRNRPNHDTPWQSKISLAADGTLLLDRADHIPGRLQERLARTIITRKFSPVGGGDRLNLEARFIFAVEDGTNGSGWSKGFHRDLSKQLRGCTFHIPPLRERKSDLPNIARNVLEKLQRERRIRNMGITESAMSLLQDYPWPGNIRELENVLWAASVLSGQAGINPRTLRPFLSGHPEQLRIEEDALEEIIEERLQSLFRRFGIDHLKDLHPLIVQHVEKPLLKLVLAETKGNRVRAAELLGINRNTLRRKMGQYNLTT